MSAAPVPAVSVNRPREADLPDVVLIDSTTGLSSVIPNPVMHSPDGMALLRAICRLNPNIVLAPLEPQRSR